MRFLRTVSTLHRLMLVWFLLSLGAAIASPIVNPLHMELVCSATGGVKVVVQTDDGATEMGSLGMSCPLCAVGGPPPAIAQTDVAMPAPLGQAVQSIPAARIAAATAAPLPARGPPAFS